MKREIQRSINQSCDFVVLTNVLVALAVAVRV
jgi:hypothetical protein